jgi:hypothetical protein
MPPSHIPSGPRRSRRPISLRDSADPHTPHPSEIPSVPRRPYFGALAYLRLQAPKMQEVLLALEKVDDRLTFKLSELSKVLQTCVEDQLAPCPPPLNPRHPQARHSWRGIGAKGLIPDTTVHPPASLTHLEGSRGQRCYRTSGHCNAMWALGGSCRCLGQLGVAVVGKWCKEQCGLDASAATSWSEVMACRVATACRLAGIMWCDCRGLVHSPGLAWSFDCEAIPGRLASFRAPSRAGEGHQTKPA